jgi:hypothetical protein
MESIEDRSASKASKSELMTLSSLRLFPFIPLTLTKEKPAEMQEDENVV